MIQCLVTCFLAFLAFLLAFFLRLAQFLLRQRELLDVGSQPLRWVFVLFLAELDDFTECPNQAIRGLDGEVMGDVTDKMLEEFRIRVLRSIIRVSTPTDGSG